ncbi:unnamed protein product [Closterium sp. Naga37s-1]|nr:unnamed protein product [Closterium sp. Naga37s-1]
MVAKRTRQLVIVRRVAAAAPVAPLHPLLLAPLSPAFICAHCVLLPPRPASPSIPLSPSLRALTLSCKAVARVFVPCTLITCRVATWCHVAGRIGGLHHHRYPLSLRRAPGARRCAQVRPGVSRSPPHPLPPMSLTPISLTPMSLTPMSLTPMSLTPMSLTPMSLTPVSLTPMSLTPMSLTPVSLTPVSLTPVSLTPMSLTPMSLTPMSLTPVSLTPMSLTPMSLTPMSLTPVSLTPVSLTPVSLTPMSLTPMSLTPMSLTPMSLTPMSLTPMSLTPMSLTPMSLTPMSLTPIAEQVARMAAADVVGVVREEVGRVGGQVDAVQALQRASAQAGGDRGAELEARAREAEERAAQLNETVGRLQAALRQHSATIATLQAAEQAAAGVAGKEGGRPLGRTVVEEDHPGRWRQHTFHRTGAYGFIQYSAYRLSAARIAVVGMGALGLRSKRRVEGCWWHRLDGHTVIAGRLTQMVMEEHHNYLYELVVLQCVLEEEVEETGGHLRIFLDRQVLFPFREDTKEKIDNGTGPMPYRFAYCGPPMHMEMEQRSVQQFVHYHRYAAGYDHFQLYDATAVTPALTAALQPLMDDGLLSIADFREAYQFDSWYFSQAVAMHDCMYGMQQRADWIAFHDLDEYLALPPPASVPALLQRYAALPYITLGMYVFSAHLCEEGPEDVWSDEEKRFAVERMVQRRSAPYCLRGEDDPKVCIDYYGHRKMFVTPRKVEAVYVHLVEKPATGGVDLSVDEMYFAHLRSLNGKGVACRPPTDKENDLPPAELEKCTTVADTAARARECAQEGFSNQFLCKPRATR